MGGAARRRADGQVRFVLRRPGPLGERRIPVLQARREERGEKEEEGRKEPPQWSIQNKNPTTGGLGTKKLKMLSLLMVLGHF